MTALKQLMIAPILRQNEVSLGLLVQSPSLSWALSASFCPWYHCSRLCLPGLLLGLFSALSGPFCVRSGRSWDSPHLCWALGPRPYQHQLRVQTKNMQCHSKGPRSPMIRNNLQINNYPPQEPLERLFPTLRFYHNHYIMLQPQAFHNSVL